MASLIRLVNGLAGFVASCLTPGVSSGGGGGSEPDVDRDWEDGTDRNQEDGVRRVTE